MLTKKIIESPTNKDNNLILFKTTPIVKVDGGEVTLQYNLGTGDYHIEGQKDRVTPYILPNLKRAVLLVKKINHYNKTDEVKEFKDFKFSELKLA